MLIQKKSVVSWNFLYSPGESIVVLASAHVAIESHRDVTQQQPTLGRNANTGIVDADQVVLGQRCEALDLGRPEGHLLDKAGQLVLLDIERAHHRLASLDVDDLVFTAWDIFKDDCYTAARKAGVLDERQVKNERNFF